MISLAVNYYLVTKSPYTLITFKIWAFFYILVQSSLLKGDQYSLNNFLPLLCKFFVYIFHSEIRYRERIMSILLAEEFCTEIFFSPEKETLKKLYISNYYDNIIINILFIINRYRVTLDLELLIPQPSSLNVFMIQGYFAMSPNCAKSWKRVRPQQI